MKRGRPRKVDDALAADTDKPISLYLPFAQTAWLAEHGKRGKRATLRRLIEEATGPPASPGPIEGDSARDAVRLPPVVVSRLDELVEQAVMADKHASRSSVVRGLIFAATRLPRRG